jgi:microcystin-dependent protein
MEPGLSSLPLTRNGDCSANSGEDYTEVRISMRAVADFADGDGRNNFALPDLRGRVPVSTGNGPGRTPRVLGQYGGEESVSLTLNQLPTHNHLASASVPASANGGDNSSPVGNIPAVISADSGSLNAYTSTSKATGSLAAGTGSPTSNTGGNQAHDNMQPYLCLSYIICLSGIFPSRP